MTETTAHLDTYIRDNLPPRELWPEMDYSVLPELATYPSRLNAAVELLDSKANNGFAEKPALYWRDEIWTYGDLNSRANQIAGVLINDIGLVPGNRVLLRSANHPMLVAAWFAVLKVGGIAIPTMPVLRERELVYIFNKAKVQFAISNIALKEDIEAAKASTSELQRIIYFDEDNNGELERLMMAQSVTFKSIDTAADDVAIIGFTSGSTGTPKGTIHFHRDLLAAADCFIGHVVNIRPGDIVCGSPQIAFLYGLCAYMVDTFRFGGASVILERATPEILLQTIERYRANVCFSTPSGYKLMLETAREHDLTSLRVCVAGGEPLAAGTFHEWHDITGIRLINGFGISELLHIFISAAGDDIRPGAIGKAIPGFQVRVVDDEFHDVSPGTIGQIIIKGPNGCRYLDDVERQKSYIREGWNLSGDLCRMDEDGYIYYEARTDDMILTGGYNVSGLEVEAVLLEHSKVRECAVIGAPDTARGEIVKAFIVMADPTEKNPATVKELQNFVKSQISAFKYPRAIEFVDELPHTATGKIQRGALRQRERKITNKS